MLVVRRVAHLRSEVWVRQQLHLFDEFRGGCNCLQLYHKDSDGGMPGREPNRVAQMCIEVTPVRQRPDS